MLEQRKFKGLENIWLGISKHKCELGDKSICVGPNNWFAEINQFVCRSNIKRGYGRNVQEIKRKKQEKNIKKYQEKKINISKE